MKKLLCAAIMVFGLSNLNAQSDPGEFTLAPQVGLNLSNYSSSQNLNNKIRTSFNAGVVAEYYFSDRWSLRSGIIYDSKGTKVTQSGQDFIDKLISLRKTYPNKKIDNLYPELIKWCKNQ